MSDKQIGYIRVSTVGQNTERQLHGIELGKIFTDKCSGKDTNRPELTALLDHIREGDTVHVHDISRMARNTENLLTLVKTITEKGVKLIFHKESLTFTGEDNPMQELMLTMLGGIYQFERSMMLERQREGIAIAKQQGKYKGKPIQVELRDNIRTLDAEGVNKMQIAKRLNCSRTTVYKALSSDL
jgi:DNA invertase Pin-like site-specific DNA recombinase